MKRKNRRRIKRERRKEDGILIVTALQAVLMLCLSVIFFTSAVILDNHDVRKSLKELIRKEDVLTENAEVLKNENILPLEKERILGEAIFTKKGTEPLKIKGNITSDFGKRINPVLNKAEFHKGVDIKAPEGERISAVFPGRCVKIGKNKFDGNYVILEHGNFKTKYCHLKETSLKEGLLLREGETLGYVGMTGLATGPHLHFEIFKEEGNIDPLSAFYNFGSDINEI